MGALFITATGTDIGKTFVTAGMIAQLREAGRTVDALKPVVTGFNPGTAADSDPAVLLRALGRPETELQRISPWRFTAPLAPDMAARREGRTLDFAALTAFCRNALAGAQDVLLIEGVGGIMVPLDERHTVLDWMLELRLRLVLVTGSYLGTISHTLSALDVLARRDLNVAALVVSESPGSSVLLDDTAAAITRFCQPIPVLPVPRVASGFRHPVFGQLSALV
jgi:dethiobiotin synthetase